MFNSHFNESDLETLVGIINLGREMPFLVGSLEKDEHFLNTAGKSVLSKACEILNFREAELRLIFDKNNDIPPIGKVKQLGTLLKPVASYGFEGLQADDENYVVKISDIPRGPGTACMETGKIIQICKNESYIRQFEREGLFREGYYETIKNKSGEEARNAFIPITRNLSLNEYESLGFANFSLPNYYLNDDELIPEHDLELVKLALDSHISRDLFDFGLVSSLNKTLKELKETQEKLLFTEKLAAVGTLVFGLAHDFKNILAPGINSQELVKADIDLFRMYLQKNGGILKTRDPKSYTMIIDSLEKSKKLLNNMSESTQKALDRISEISRGKGEKKIEEINLESLVDKSLEIYVPTLEKNGIGVIKNYKTEPYRLLGTAYEFESIFQNLITNSIDALDGRQNPVIHISTQLNDGRIRLEHYDNGCGMTEEVRNKCFNAFYSTKDIGIDGRQRGMGLFQVANYVLSNGGEIKIETEPEEYTKVILEFMAEKV